MYPAVSSLCWNSSLSTVPLILSTVPLIFSLPWQVAMSPRSLSSSGWCCLATCPTSRGSTLSAMATTRTVCLLPTYQHRIHEGRDQRDLHALRLWWGQLARSHSHWLWLCEGFSLANRGGCHCVSSCGRTGNTERLKHIQIWSQAKVTLSS